MANVSRQPIRSLQPQMQNSVIIGIIIRSQNSQALDPSKMRYNGGSRAVWNFTLRDSVQDFINATVWGTVEFINKLFTTFSIGSVVEIINAKISDKKPDDPNDMYVPEVTSPFVLTLNQNSSLVKMHDSPAAARYQHLFRIPTKNPAGALTLSYILENMEQLSKQFVDVVVVVTFISQTREIITKNGELASIREFEVGDSSTHQTVSLTLWDREWIQLADKWEAKQTVLFLADAYINFLDRMKKSALSIGRKTIITENPDIEKTKELKLAFQNKPDFVSSSPFSVPNPNSITKKMSIRDITNRLNIAVAVSEERLQLLVKVIAEVDDMNIDGNDGTLIITKCAKCKRLIVDGNDSCMNLECPFGSGLKSPKNVTCLNVLINVKDDTGYLVGCRLRDAAAEQAIGCSAKLVREMTRDERKALKEKYNKKLCVLRMQILGATTFQKPIYNVLDIKLLNESENEDNYEPLNIDDLDLDSYGA